MKYDKTIDDLKQEKYDLANHPILKWLKNPEVFKFNVGDILIKKTLGYSWDPQSHKNSKTWKTSVVNHLTKIPKRYMYVFENELGIGYIKQLTADGTGFTSNTICVASLNPDVVRLELDSDYADAIILGDVPDKLEPNQKYLDIKNFRKNAMAANRKLLININTYEREKAWLSTLKIGDVFWAGYTFDAMCDNKYTVVEVLPSLGGVETTTESGNRHRFYGKDLSYRKICMVQPHPMKPTI